MLARVKLRFFFNPIFIIIINQNNRVGFERVKEKDSNMLFNADFRKIQFTKVY